jgi:DNA-binding response OmpR family regulator
MMLGADEYITKPFDLDYLEMAIKKVLAVSI